MTTTVASAQETFDHADADHLAAEAKVEAAQAHVDDLRERVRLGENVTARDISDATAAVEHAALALEGAVTRRQQAKEALHAAKVVAATERHNQAAPMLQEVQQARAALQVAAQQLAAAVSARNDHERSTWRELANLGVAGFTGPVARPTTTDLAFLIAQAVVAGAGHPTAGPHSIQSESGTDATAFLNSLAGVAMYGSPTTTG